MTFLDHVARAIVATLMVFGGLAAMMWIVSAAFDYVGHRWQVNRAFFRFLVAEKAGVGRNGPEPAGHRAPAPPAPPKATVHERRES